MAAFGQMFVPHRDLCINESLLLWQGQLRFRQYIPSKRKRFGIKTVPCCLMSDWYVLQCESPTLVPVQTSHMLRTWLCPGKVVLTTSNVNNRYIKSFSLPSPARAKTEACGW
ncbi:hypothetical protein QQF64_036399 [Cirrhinus molitorella]|uniref:PiggyBac transposable element-derived protein domain-containing protein n=1 Tax=Cirrhinus molitorella TaxID=172907 RepID=A0ABR3NIG7_9TELE